LHGCCETWLPEDGGIGCELQESATAWLC
jgi:hypothetical protein